MTAKELKWKHFRGVDQTEKGILNGSLDNLIKILMEAK